MKQTAVEWLEMQLKENMLTSKKELDKLFELAKEIERLQSIDDFTCGNFEAYKGANGFPSMLVNDYINKKYGGNK